MSNKPHLRSLRRLAEGKLAPTVPGDLETLTVDEVRRLVYELEVHRVELEIQNQQLKESQLAAEESKERYRELYESAPVGYLTLGSKGVVVGANAAAGRLLGIRVSRLVGQKLSRFVSPRHQDRWHLERRALERGEPRLFDLELTPSDAGALQTQVAGSLGGEKGTAHATLRLAVLDVTELRRTERALRTAASQASLAEHRERRKLASDLHDDAGQLLSLASMKLRAVGASLGGESALGIREVEQVLADARRKVSSLSFELSPPLLHDVGLVAAAEWLAEDLERRYGLVVTVSTSREPVLDEGAAVTLFRAMRELLINVAKHAGVAAATVEMGREGDMARIVVSDTGVGFQEEAVSPGFGLLALRERLGSLGGGLTVDSVSGSGTRAVASVPCSPRGRGVRDEGGSGA